MDTASKGKKPLERKKRLQTPPTFPRSCRPSEKDVVVNDELQLGHGFNAKFHLLVERSLNWLDSSSQSAGTNILPLKLQLSEAIVRTIHETDGIFLKKGVAGKWEQVDREAAHTFVLDSLGRVLCNERPAISKFTCVAGPIDATHLVRSEAHLDQYLPQILPNLKNQKMKNQLPVQDSAERRGLLTRVVKPNHQALSIEHLKPTPSCNTHDAKHQKKGNKQVTVPHKTSAAMQNILQDELQHRRQLVMFALQKHDKLKQSQQRQVCQIEEPSVSKRKAGNPQTRLAPKSLQQTSLVAAKELLHLSSDPRFSQNGGFELTHELHWNHSRSTTASDHLHHANILPSSVAMNPPHFLSSTGSPIEPVRSNGHQDEDRSRNPLSMKFKRPRR